jgi:hypothetical protein
MGRVIDVLSLLLLVGACAAFGLGAHQLAESRDLAALYWFAAGALALKASSDLLRPKAGTR